MGWVLYSLLGALVLYAGVVATFLQRTLDWPEGFYGVFTKKR